ncbi:hypothetical protein CKC_05850 [Candidatus Liberibacter solanacearum CLso-ZC1]|uniref:Uncharacterized protein n=1 Tax=Liberibacter solanacearum (strain CLso-ZC1) TaxID=658172 RepID=E4UC58_LIBSC|nr:hypothetical protein [Candidatus Liberibacter solanacearum]ADR51948.1 hypothetical protein CKC_00985 [Candidatus Liberibacter solanacearum CLso-ZC1]ADR52915.1 hypothetical protein CKC_05850 [Candidatus Liberibacter solanacearum CLso-ZC1]
MLSPKLKYYTPTEIGEMLTPKLTVPQVNYMLVQDGFQLEDKHDDPHKPMWSKLVADQIQYAINATIIAYIADGMREDEIEAERN